MQHICLCISWYEQPIYLCTSSADYMAVYIKCRLYGSVHQVQTMCLCTLSAVYMSVYIKVSLIMCTSISVAYMSVYIKCSLYVCVHQEQPMFLCTSRAAYVSVYIKFSLCVYIKCSLYMSVYTKCSLYVCVRRPNVFDVGPTLYKCYTNVLCLLGCQCRPISKAA